jgi:hypothetical protein
MDNLKEVVERGWQVGLSHSFEFNNLTFYESVGLQKWNKFYIVQIIKIDEEKWWDEEHEIDVSKKFNTFNEAIIYIESNSRVLRDQLNVSKGQKWFNTENIKYYIDEI